MTPTRKTLKLARELSAGGHVAIVEHWHCHAKIRQDLLGMFDVLMLDLHLGQITGIQTSSRSHHAERVKKLQANPFLKQWKACGGRALVWTWKPGKRDTAADVYETVL